MTLHMTPLSIDADAIRFAHAVVPAHSEHKKQCGQDLAIDSVNDALQPRHRPLSGVSLIMAKKTNSWESSQIACSWQTKASSPFLYPRSL